MKGILTFLLAGAATPALAQHSGHTAPPTPAATSSCTPEHAAMGHCQMPAPAQPAADPNSGRIAATPAPAPTTSCTPEHAAMGHCKMAAPAQPAADPNAGSIAATPAPAPSTSCTPEHAAMGHCKMPPPVPQGIDPHAGHRAPAAQAPASNPAGTPACTADHAAMGHCKLGAPAQAGADPHAGHVMSQSDIPVAPPPAAARSGPENGADQFYNPGEMAASREEMRKHHGGLTAYKILIDQAEVKIRNGREGYGWDAQGWYGGDINKLWIKTEGEGAFGEHVESAEVQALWSRAIDPWFDFQVGVRYDIRPDPERAYLVAGIQGLAPYWFEVDGSVFLSNKGDVSARFEAEYDLRITQRLILQPMFELDLAAQDVRELGIGSGLSEASIGARLRYEIFPGSGPASVAPYVGIEYERAFGDTADFRRASGEDAGGWNLLIGLRTWF